MVPLFSVSYPLSEKLTVFSIWRNLKLSIFYHPLIWPNSLYLGKSEDSGNGVGDFFAHKVMRVDGVNIEYIRIGVFIVFYRNIIVEFCVSEESFCCFLR